MHIEESYIVLCTNTVYMHQTVGLYIFLLYKFSEDIDSVSRVYKVASTACTRPSDNISSYSIYIPCFASQDSTQTQKVQSLVIKQLLSDARSHSDVSKLYISMTNLPFASLSII